MGMAAVCRPASALADEVGYGSRDAFRLERLGCRAVRRSGRGLA